MNIESDLQKALRVAKQLDGETIQSFAAYLQSIIAYLISLEMPPLPVDVVTYFLRGIRDRKIAGLIEALHSDYPTTLAEALRAVEQYMTRIKPDNPPSTKQYKDTKKSDKGDKGGKSRSGTAAVLIQPDGMQVEPVATFQGQIMTTTPAQGGQAPPKYVAPPKDDRSQPRSESREQNYNSQYCGRGRG